MRGRLIAVVCICAVLFLFVVFIGKEKAKAEALPSSYDFAETIDLFTEKDTTYIIDKDIDLEGKTAVVAQGVTLSFRKGIISNGKLVGNDTRIIYDGTVFNHVNISGSWNIDSIRSSMFANISEDNALIDLFALSNDSVNNHIIIEDGLYWIKAESSRKHVLNLRSNTDCEIKGAIQLRANDFPSYSLLFINGCENVRVFGSGSLIGDKDHHTGTDGQWGMGVQIKNSKNISVDGLSIEKMWGDCIYIGNLSQSVTINNCNLKEGRRQGISITSGKDIFIQNCSISDVGGHSPEYAIDIEPNKQCKIDNVSVSKVSVSNCVGGFKISGYATDSHVGKIIYKDCTVDVISKRPFQLSGCDKVVVHNCKVSKKGNDFPFWCKLIGDFEVDSLSVPHDVTTPFKFTKCEKRNIRNIQHIKKI